MADTRYGAQTPVTYRYGSQQVLALYMGSQMVWPNAGVVNVPVDAITWEDFSPALFSGATVGPPSDVWHWEDFAPVVSSIGVPAPVDIWQWEDITPSVSIGAIVRAPVDDLVWSDYVINFGYDYSKAYSQAFNAIPHDHGVTAPLDSSLSWVDTPPEIIVPPPFEDGIIQNEGKVEAPITTSPGTTFSVTGIPWSMNPHATRTTTVVIVGQTGRGGIPSVTLRNSQDTSTVGEFETQYLWRNPSNLSDIVLIASIRNPSNNTNAIRINTPGSDIGVRNFAMFMYNSRHMDSLVPVDSYFKENAAFNDQYTYHDLVTRAGGFVFGGIFTNSDVGSPYPSPFYAFDPDWLSSQERRLSNSRGYVGFRGVSPLSQNPQEIILDRKTTKLCHGERVHMISLR